MTPDQARIAVPLLNSYAHEYLGLKQGDVMVGAGEKDGLWDLFVATKASQDGVQIVKDFDAAKAIIDGLIPSVSAPIDGGESDA